MIHKVALLLPVSVYSQRQYGNSEVIDDTIDFNQTDIDYYDPFRTYCDENEVTITSNFLTFGSSQVAFPAGHDVETSQWTDTRDLWILDEDDGYYSIAFDCRFGGQLVQSFCISSNGPIYMGACPADSEGNPILDWDPLPISTAPVDQWSGVSAFWADFAAHNGGNIYYRKVSTEDNNPDSTRDLVIIANKLNAQETINEAHIITFHKIKDHSEKQECDVGISFQYIIVPRETEQNPFVHIAYGELGWDYHVLVAGWNAYFTPENYAFDFTNDMPGILQVSDLARKSFSCDGVTCQLTECPGNLVYDVVNQRATCAEDEQEVDTYVAEVTVNIETEQECDADALQAELDNLYPEIQSFLDYTYQWSEIQNVILNQIECVEVVTTNQDGSTMSLRSVIQLRVSGQIEAWIEQGIFANQEEALEFIQNIAEELIAVPLAAMDVWNEVSEDILTNEGLNSELAGNFEITNPQTQIQDVICAWGKYHDESTHSCVDINECDSISDFCAPEHNAGCTNNNPGYTCHCESGYELVADEAHANYNQDYPARGPFKCIDIDECALQTDDCTAVQTCLNLSGSFRCVDQGIDVLDNMDLEDLVTDNLVSGGMDSIEAGVLVTSIFDHGCICSEIDAGRSDYHPHDELDRICQKYMKCKKCTKNYFSGCDNTFFTVDHYVLSNTYSCDGGVTCENKTCECSLNFAEDVANYLSNNADFVADESATCTIRQGTGPPLNCDEFGL